MRGYFGSSEFDGYLIVIWVVGQWCLRFWGGERKLSWPETESESLHN